MLVQVSRTAFVAYSAATVAGVTALGGRQGTVRNLSALLATGSPNYYIKISS